MLNQIFRVALSTALLYMLVMVMSWPSNLYASRTSGIIKVIETNGVSRIDRDELINLVCRCTGSELDMDRIRYGIRRAFKMGIFLDIQVITEPYDDGVRLIYDVVEVPLIDKVTVKGNKHFSNRQLKKTITLKSGDDFRVEYLENVKNQIIQFYQRKGFTDADVEIVAHTADHGYEVDIGINIDEGLPVTVKRVDVPDDARFLVSLSAGEIFDIDEMEIVTKKLTDYYKDTGHINPVVGPYEFDDGVLVIPVTKGPRLEVVFRNNTVLTDRKLLKEVTYIEDREISDELTAKITERIRNAYMKEGYHYVQVAAGTEKKDDVIVVTFMIYEGQMVTLRSIILNGVSINPDAVRKVFALHLNKPFNDNLLASSKDALVRFYQALGFIDVEVTDILKHFSNEGTELELEINVTEGPQKIIAGIDVYGNSIIETDEILRAVKISAGSPYNRIDVGDARYRILSLYSSRGLMDARVNVESDVEEDNVFISFNVVENKPSVVGKIILRGNNKTKAKIVKRELTLIEGDLYDSDEVTKIKQNLYKLGLFNEVSVEMQEPDPTSDEQIVRDMLVRLKEGNAGSIEVSFGYGDYEEFRGALAISYRNIGGYNRQVGFRTELSSVEKKYVLNFQEPWLFNKPNLPLKVYLVKEETRSVDIDDRNVFYKIDKLSFIAGVEKELTKGFKVALNYEYSFTDTKDVQPDVILSKEDTGTLGIGSISTSLFYDTRDNPFNPSSGSIHGITLKFASEAFLSEINFMKGSFQSAWFTQLHKNVVFAFSLRGGISYSYEDTEELPLIERFFLGGRSSARGYENDRLGPKGDNNTPTGGNVFALMNNEFRFDVGKGIGLVTFVDAGNVWTRIDLVDDELEYTVGAGLRYKTPVGPLRVDYGHKINREPGESAGEVHFSFGHVF